jgi:16S rRNA (adenine1518-N6/adenine1519-N6)-dimethyltransferase
VHHRPRKRFGQHFLHDPGTIARIVTVIHPEPGQAMVEIGPGQGAITCPMLARLGRLDVIELDRDLVAPLEARCGELGALAVHNTDALKFDFAALAAERGRLRVVGNLPYNISTPLVFHLLRYTDVLTDIHFMLQKEVVERLTARPGSRDYGRLSLMVQFRCHAEKLFTVGRGVFVPPPKVESAFVRLVPRPNPPVHLEDTQVFEHLVAQAFSQRRKTLRNALKGVAGIEQIRAAGLDPGARPEDLDLEQYARLSRVLTQRG